MQWFTSGGCVLQQAGIVSPGAGPAQAEGVLL